jgi:chromosome segregation protein
LVQFSKLRINGFKSFVDSTEVLIDPGLTGIVGPNGCGKSNLVEALRWVMGENSPKRMRGGGMEDVIFTGTATRPARNVAEVALVLDNAARKAPAHYNNQSEIEVSRRIERGAGSNYRVNGREVRARDVQLLFADSATGAHSTALVSQGRIGMLINAKATERRGLLEEAAGITGLHSRRHEAELRLRAAETNLERLDDVIATLESQLHGLKKQARQATRYRNLARHIRRNEAILLHLQTTRAERAREEAAARLAEAEQLVAELTGGAATASTEQAEAGAALPALREAEAAAAAALQRLVADRGMLEREEARVAEARQQVDQRVAQIDGDRARASRLAEDAATAQTRLDEEGRTLNAAAADETDALARANARLEEARTSVAEIETAVGDKASAIAAQEARGGALERRAEELGQRLERLRGQIGEVQRELTDLTAGQGDEGALAAAVSGIRQSEDALEQRKVEAESAAELLTRLREAETAAREALREAEAKRGRLEAEISALAALLEPNESDLWPPVVDSVQVTPGFETALGAALGDDLSAPADGGAPVHWLALGRYDPVPALPAGAQPLSGFVRGPAVLERRLSQIGVVPDDAVGARLQGGLLPGQRLVTREGALWRWDGYAARPDAPTGAATRLGHRNRLAELRGQVEEITGQCDELRREFEAARRGAEEATAADRGARGAQAAAYATAQEAREAHARLAQAEAAAASRLTALEETRERLRGELAECEAALAQARADRAVLPDLSAARAEMEELRTEAARRRAELAEQQAEAAHLRREAEARRQRLSAIEAEHATWTRRAEDAEQHLAELDQRREEAEAEVASLADRPEEIAHRREALAEQIEGAETRRSAAADALALGETRQAEADRALKAEEQRLGTAREDRVRAEAEVAQSDQGLAQLRARVQERLECAPDKLLEVAEIEPGLDLPPEDEVESKLARLVRERENMGPVNLLAEQEAQEIDEQITALQGERADLVSAIARLRQGIASLNREGRERLLAAFQEVDKHFSELFVRLFGGGRAHLKLTEAEDPLDAGLEIMASPPGKRLQVLSLLSGGEQALTALSLLFAVFLTNPAPICVLDEVDAPLDDANVDRFLSLVEELSHSLATRFLIITHHRMTMARMDRLYGVTMGERGISQLVSVDLESAEDLRESA